MGTIERLTAGKSVVIFGKSTCCMCHVVKTLITNFGANPTTYELDTMPVSQKLEKALVAACDGRPSFPVVYIGQELVGGEKEVISLHVKGKLVPLLKKAKAIWI